MSKSKSKSKSTGKSKSKFTGKSTGKSTGKCRSEPATDCRQIVDFIRSRILDEGFSDIRSELEEILERCRDGDATPNEIASVLQEAVEEMGNILYAAEDVLESDKESAHLLDHR
jgi:hypothetical protein